MKTVKTPFGAKITVDEFREIHRPGKNKYGAKKTMYRGVYYDSKLEANYAANLDIKKKAGLIHKWERQAKVDLPINGKKWYTWKIDFKVWITSDRYEYHEVKGAETAEFRLKRDAFKILYPNETLKIIKK